MQRLFLAVVLLFSSLIAIASTTLKPTGYVNDFANIIPDAREVVLEKQLRDYEKKTSVEMVVVTTPSLDGEVIETWSIELATQWGIGKKDADNGLLLVVAPNERTYRVEVGYGLEGVVPDVIASRFSREILPDAFRKGDYASGIENLMSKFMAHIGDSSAEERAQATAERARIESVRAERLHQQMMEFVSFGAVFLTVAVLSYLIIKRIKEWMRKKALRKKITGDLRSLESEIFEMGAFGRSFDISAWPAWILPQVMKNLEALSRGLLDIEIMKEEVRALVPSDPDAANGRLGDCVRNLNGLKRNLVALEDTGKEVENFRKYAVEAVHRSVESANSLEIALKNSANAGFRLEAIVKDATMSEIACLCGSALKKLELRGKGAHDTSDEVLKEAEKLQHLVESVQAPLDTLRRNKEYVDRELPLIENALLETETDHKEKISAVMSGFSGLAPKYIWEETEEKFRSVPEKLREIQPLLEKAKEMGSMTEQRFDDARKCVEEAKLRLENSKDIHAAVLCLDEEFHKAMLDAPFKMTNAESAIRNAESSVKDSRTGSDAREKLSQAKKKMKEAKEMLSSEPVDWLSVLAIVMAVYKLARSAKEMADNDIARKKEEEEESRRRRNSSFSSSSGSSGSNGFGGFGGGGFGGGGAIGKW